MAVGWMTALKLVPWGDVLAATPQIVQGARKLLGKKRPGAAEPPGTDISAAEAGSASLPAAVQLQRLTERIEQLEQAQQDSAVLIQSLAEQNAQVVRAVEELRLRSQRLTGALAVVGVFCAGLLVWALRQ